MIKCKKNNDTNRLFMKLFFGWSWMNLTSTYNLHEKKLFNPLPLKFLIGSLKEPFVWNTKMSFKFFYYSFFFAIQQRVIKRNEQTLMKVTKNCLCVWSRRRHVNFRGILCRLMGDKNVLFPDVTLFEFLSISIIEINFKLIDWLAQSCWHGFISSYSNFVLLLCTLNCTLIYSLLSDIVTRLYVFRE